VYPSGPLMKVLIVEDDEKVASFLARMLAEEGYIPDICTNGADAVRQASAVAYDAILLDWMLPDKDGIAVCRELRGAGSATPIIMLTARGQVRERVLGFESGADDFVVKPFEIDELLARLQALLRRAQGLGRMKFGTLEIDRMQRLATVDGRPVELTTREFALLLYLAGRPDRVVTRSDLLSHVWSTNFDRGSNLVDVHISRLRDKLGDHAWMIDTVRGKGYRLRRTQP
jgi:DNA-binding response OmpR family regulator